MKKWLTEIFGEINFSDDKTDRIAYSVEASHMEGLPEAIVWPKNAEQVHKLVSFAKRNEITLVPRGAGTGLVGGTTATGSLVVDMSKMNNIKEIGSDYATVEAGTVLDDLNHELKKRGKTFPIIPGSHKACTIGGMIATNASGRRMDYGKMCDWVIEIELVDGTGLYQNIKRDTIKNFCGMEGTTGIIISAKVRTTTLPAPPTLSAFSFNTITALMDKVKELKEDARVKSIEYMDELCSDYIGLGDSLHIIAEFEGPGGNIENIEEIETIYTLRNNLSTQLRAAKYVISEDPEIPIENMGKFLHWLRQRTIPTFGHIGRGVIHPHFKEKESSREEMHKLVKNLNGKAGGEHGIGLSKKQHICEEDLKKAMILKAQYDPKNILNRGKLV